MICVKLFYSSIILSLLCTNIKKSIKMKQIKFLIAIALVSVLVLSCKETKQEEVQDAVQTEVEAVQEEVDSTVEEVKEVVDSLATEVSDEVKEVTEDVKDAVEAVKE